MVSLRRRRLLGLSHGYCQRPLLSWGEGTAQENPTRNAGPGRVQPRPSDDVSQLEENTMKVEHGTGSSSSKELLEEPFPGLPVKRRKRHRRKNSQNQEPCLMRGVYFKNMKWQAAIKVDKKQIHLGTVSSQEEAARLYDRAAFMCGREPNFELSEHDKQELRKFKWEDFLAMTRHAITNKKHRRRMGPGAHMRPEPSPVTTGEWGSEQGAKSVSRSEGVDIDMSVS